MTKSATGSLPSCPRPPRRLGELCSGGIGDLISGHSVDRAMFGAGQCYQVLGTVVLLVAVQVVHVLGRFQIPPVRLLPHPSMLRDVSGPATRRLIRPRMVGDMDVDVAVVDEPPAKVRMLWAARQTVVPSDIWLGVSNEPTALAVGGSRDLCASSAAALTRTAVSDGWGAALSSFPLAIRRLRSRLTELVPGDEPMGHSFAGAALKGRTAPALAYGHTPIVTERAQG